MPTDAAPEVPEHAAAQYIERIRAAKNRGEAAIVYADAMFALMPTHCGAETWEPINRAILDRWSMSGLRYVKEKAWKLASPK